MQQETFKLTIEAAITLANSNEDYKKRVLRAIMRNSNQALKKLPESQRGNHGKRDDEKHDDNKQSNGGTSSKKTDC